MTRLQKKCFAASVGMHVALLVILIASSAFRSRPVRQDIPLVMTMVNLPVTDETGVGGGSPQPSAPAATMRQPPTPAPTPPTPHTQSTPTPPTPRETQPVEPPRHHEAPPEPKPDDIEPQPVERSESGLEPVPRPRRQHVVKPTFDEAPTAETHPTRRKRQRHVDTSDQTDSSAETAATAARAARTRARMAAVAALDELATGVKKSGAAGTVVDMPGQGGGQAFIGYETYIYNAYYHAWVVPDSVVDRGASVDVKLVVARDGSIVEAEIVNQSGERDLDRSVERALRAVHQLPPFPSTTQDQQRSFVLRFNLEAKEGSG